MKSPLTCLLELVTTIIGLDLGLTGAEAGDVVDVDQVKTTSIVKSLPPTTN